MHAVMDHIFVRLLAFVAGILLALPLEMLHAPLAIGIKLAAAAALLGFAVMPLVIWLARRTGAMDYPGERRQHVQPTPRIGGLALVFAINLTLFLNFNYSLELKGVCISALIVAVVSFWDDLRGLSAAIKLFVQLLALAVLWWHGVHVEFAPPTWWGYGLEFIVTALWVVGITNAFNFLDGINGLAASLAAAVTALMAILAATTGQTYMLLLCLAMVGAALGFLPDNARYSKPPRTFLGDVGSTYLGWMMASIAVMGDWSSEGPLKAYAAPLLIFSVMIFDMIHTTVARIARGDVRSVRQWIDYVGRDHLHHRLMDLGCSQPQAVWVVVAMALLIGLSALALVRAQHLSVWLLLLQAIIFYATLSFLMVKRGGKAARQS